MTDEQIKILYKEKYNTTRQPFTYSTMQVDDFIKMLINNIDIQIVGDYLLGPNLEAFNIKALDSIKVSPFMNMVGNTNSNFLISIKLIKDKRADEITFRAKNVYFTSDDYYVMNQDIIQTSNFQQEILKGVLNKIYNEPIKTNLTIKKEDKGITNDNTNL